MAGNARPTRVCEANIIIIIGWPSSRPKTRRLIPDRRFLWLLEAVRIIRAAAVAKYVVHDGFLKHTSYSLDWNRSSYRSDKLDAGQSSVV